jgi:hypothetical protein
MYERFTDRARKVMQLANQEAQRLNHEYIGTEHILLGLVKEGSGVAANVLKNLDIDLRKIRLEIEKVVQPGPDMVTRGKLPQTPRAKKVIEYSIEEARNLNHNYVGTEHLLLGLLREQEGVANHVLSKMGIALQVVRQEVLNIIGQYNYVPIHLCPNCPGLPRHARRMGLWLYRHPLLSIFTGGMAATLAWGVSGFLCMGSAYTNLFAVLGGVCFLTTLVFKEWKSHRAR